MTSRFDTCTTKGEHTPTNITNFYTSFISSYMFRLLRKTFLISWRCSFTKYEACCEKENWYRFSCIWRFFTFILSYRFSIIMVVMRMYLSRAPCGHFCLLWMDFCGTLLSLRMCCIFWYFNPYWFDYPNNILWRIQISHVLLKPLLVAYNVLPYKPRFFPNSFLRN
jgi:hypothetical protein